MAITHHVARERLSVSTSIVSPTADTVNTTQAAGSRSLRVVYGDFDVQDDDVRVTFDGTDPVALTTGEIWYAGEKYRVWGIHNLLLLEFIREFGDVEIEVNYRGGKA